MSDAFADLQDQSDASDYEPSENIAEDVIEYVRGNIVGHEQEALLMYLATLTGWAYDKDCHVNTIGVGPPGSGKSLTKNTVEKLLDDTDTYTKTDASSNAILDSVEWDLSLVAPLDEYDKVDRAIVEVLKSSNPEDGGYSKDRNVEDPDARGGYSPTEVSADAIPWVLLYAPTSKKGGINDELEDRALILYFSNDKNTRRGIGRKEFGHDHIDSSEYEQEYIYDTQVVSAGLREHVRNLPVNKHYEEDDDGEQHLVSRTGDTLVYQPRWVWYAVEPIFNIDEDYTNRVYGIVNNLIRASALLNHHERPRREVEVYVDEDSTETETRDAVVVQAQDVANVLSCLPTLLSTTHQLTPLKRKLLDAVDNTQAITDGDGTTVSDVQDWLDDNDIPHPSRSTLKKRMDDLVEDYYLKSWDNAGGKNGTATVYEKHEQGALKPPRIHNLDGVAEQIDGIDLATEDVVDIDPQDPFEDVWDPIRDQPFKQTVHEFDEQFSGEEPDTDAGSFMGGDDESNDSTSDDSDEQATLGDVDEDGVDDVSGDEESVELDPDGEPENPTEQYVYENIQDATGEVFSSNHDVTHFLGIVNNDAHATETDMSGTVVDPDHELWQGRPDLRDDRVMSEGDALRELHDAYSELKHKDIVAEDESGGPPAMYKLQAADL